MLNWNANEDKQKTDKIYIEKESIQALVWAVSHKHCFKRHEKGTFTCQIGLLWECKITVSIVLFWSLL